MKREEKTKTKQIIKQNHIKNYQPKNFKQKTVIAIKATAIDTYRHTHIHIYTGKRTYQKS